MVGTSPAAYPETSRVKNFDHKIKKLLALPYSGHGMNFFQRIINVGIRLTKYLFRAIGEWRTGRTVPGVSAFCG